jgi:hypothetical protein
VYPDLHLGPLAYRRALGVARSDVRGMLHALYWGRSLDYGEQFTLMHDLIALQTLIHVRFHQASHTLAKNPDTLPGVFFVHSLPPP